VQLGEFLKPSFETGIALVKVLAVEMSELLISRHWAGEKGGKTVWPMKAAKTLSGARKSQSPLHSFNYTQQPPQWSSVLAEMSSVGKLRGSHGIL
jgi:hypothetical protein